MYPQQTGWQQQPLYGQQTGFQQQQQQQPQQQGGFARPPLPPQASGQYSFLSAPPPSSSGLSPQQTGWQQPALRQQATGWSGAGLVPQATGWQGAGGQQQQPLMPQATGWHDPRLQMMQSSFMPMNTSAPFQSGVPVFQQPTLPAGNLQSSMNLLNQTPSVKTPKIPWALTKDERKNYDQIFRAWDKDGSGFISGEMAREVFGQSGLGQDDMAQIWTLADMDNRGKLNIQEFHVAMALIYRRLNGNDMPAVLPAELVPASSKDLDSNVDFLKSLLRNDTNSRSTSTELSYAKTRSFNDASPAGGERKKDGTVYKHDEDRELGKTYKSSSRHLDRSSVRTGKESASDDLAQIKRDLANTSSRLDDRLEERGRRDEEDELLDEEMNDLKRRVRRIKDDIEYVSSGRPTSQKDEERRKLERELLHIAHEKIPDVERRIEEREERKKREDREGVRARDRRNDRYGGRYEDRGDDDDRDRGYRGSYDRDDRDYRDRNRDRSRDRYDSYSSSSRDRPRSPPPAPAPPAHSLAAPAAPPAPPKPTASPAPAGQTREQRLAEARARALQKLEDRKRALGLGSAEPEVPTVDSSVSERIEREKREAEEAGKRAEEERAKKEADRRARLEAEKGGPAKPASAPVPAPPALPAGGAPAVAPKAAPPPPKPRSILKSRAPAPPPSKAGPSPAVQEATQDEEDPVERQLRERETRLKKSAADRATRLAALEAEEEEERKAEEALHARRQQAKSSAASTPPAPKSPEPSPALAVPAVAVAQASTSPSGGSLGAHNPFAKFSAVGGAGSSAAASPAAPDAARFFKPPTQTFTPPPMAAPVAKAPTKKFVPTPADDEDWDVIEDKGNESDSSDDYDTAKRRKAELAKALFGGIMPSSSPAPSSNPPSAAPTPAPAAASASPTDSAPPKNPMLAALGGGSAEPAARGGLFAAIQGGAKLKKAVTVDKSSPAVTGAVVGDAAPPAHISDVLRAVSPPPSPPADTNRAEPTLANANRQSVDWYAGLAANAPSGASAPTSLPAQVEEDEEEDAHTNRQGSQAPVGALDGVDMSVSLRVRTLFSYDGQRPEDLSFTENVMIDAHPATDPESPWYYGMTIKDRKSGWFPSSYVADVADVVQAKALYSYTGSSDQELPFVEGDVLTIVEHTDDSWWKAVSDGIVFLVPAAYLELQGSTQADKAALPSQSPMPNAVLSSPAVTPALRDHDASMPESTTAAADARVAARLRSGSSTSQGGGERRAPPPAPAHPRRLSAAGPSSGSADAMPQENSDASSDSEDDLSEEADDDPKTRERRESERLRVLEAAGLRVTVDSSPSPRPRRARRPPPSAPLRRPQSMVLDGGSHLARPKSFESSSSSLPPSPATEEPAPRLEDAYDRYEALLSAQAEKPPASLAAVPDHSSPSLLPASPSASIGSAVATGPREGRLSQMMAKISASVAPMALPEPSKRLSVVNISGPSRQSIASPTTSSGVTRATTPAAESTSWASLIGDHSILDSLSGKERKRQEAMFEFIATEASYVRDLQLIVGEFYARLVKILDDKELVVIFANVEDILVTSTFMLSELEERQKASRLYLSSIADILAMHMQNVEIYLPYCSNQGTAIKILQSLREKNAALGSTLVAMRSEPALRGLDLSTYLLSPMQRITRYPLLLKQIHNYTEPGEDRQKLEMAIDEAECVLNRINEQIRARESFDRLAALSQDLWVGSGRLDLTSPTRSMGPRRLLREGKVTKGRGTKRELTVVLTNDILVLIEASRTLYRMPMPLNEISVADYPSSSSFGFLLVPRYRGDRVLLKTSTAREAAEWVAAIERAITDERRARLDMS